MAKTFVPVAYTYYQLQSGTIGGDDDLGECDYGAKTITIDKSLNDYGPWSVTFWHEWFHATFYENGYAHMTDNEGLVEACSQAVMRMFSDPQGRVLIRDMLKYLDPQKKKPAK